MRRLLQSIGLLAFLVWPLLGSAALRNGRIEITSVKGSGSLVDPLGHSVPAVEGYVFQQGYKVLCGPNSTVELVFSNGSKYVLESNTGMLVRTFRQVPTADSQESGFQAFDREVTPSVTEIQLLYGKIDGLPSLLDPLSTASVRSPVGVISVRGTYFSQERGTIFSMELGAEPKTGNDQIIVECFRGAMEATIFEQLNGPISIPARRKLVAVITDTRMASDSDKAKQASGRSEKADGNADAGTTDDVANQDSGDSASRLKTRTGAAGEQSVDGHDVKGTEVYIGDVSIPRYGVIGEYARGPLGSTSIPLFPTPSPNTTGSAKTSDVIQQILDNINKVVEKQQINPSPTGG